MKQFAYTAFLVSMYSYAAFVFFDYIRPGFVSFHFSVHLILLLALVFGLVLVRGEEAVRQSKVLELIGFLFVGVLFAIIFWREGVVFGDFRLIVTIALPFLAMLSWFSLNESV